MRGMNESRYEQFETSPETIEQELRPVVCEQQQADRIIVWKHADTFNVWTMMRNWPPCVTQKILSRNCCLIDQSDMYANVSATWMLSWPYARF